ncbi:nucleotide exchange factor GrpE [Methanocella conradii]|uniref:nucleotide exchange factor GrpE n=1 Tax=Methanocella conradii TaxID=1175444 RepID=UPI00157C182E|nr:nucleotide exchange factor GrpE [Methanocella conradii]
MDTVEQGEKENMTEPKAEGTAKPEDDELALARKQAEEYKTLAMYLKADLENYKKRAAREREEFARSANESLIMDLLDVYENLERALITARNSDDSMAKGLEMIYSSMKAALEKHGLKPIKTVGEKFDPYLHEAVMQAVDNDHEEDTILEEIQRGYTLNMKVIRCAKVKVSKRGE